MCQSKADGGRRCNAHTPNALLRRRLVQSLHHQEHVLATAQDPETVKKARLALSGVKKQQAALDAERAALRPAHAFEMALTPNTEAILSQLDADGLRAYIVGGSVRDAVLGGTTPKDVDIEVHGGDAAQVAASLRKLGHVDEVGKSFGVLKLRLGREDFDVSLPRRDQKTGTGHRDFEVEVDPKLSLEEATARRDYTINALLYSHRHRLIIDKHGGLADLKAGYLRHVSDAFDEDPLRVLRGVQMAARFNMRLHPDTIEKANTLREQYGELSQERVCIEFQKLYQKGRDLNRAVETLRATGWDRLFAGLDQADDGRLRADLDRANSAIKQGRLAASDRELQLSALFAANLPGKDRQAFLNATAVGVTMQRRARQLTEATLPAPDRTTLLSYTHDTLPRDVSLRDVLQHAELRGEAKKAVALIRILATELGVLDGAKPDLLTGNDVLAHHADRKPGPWVREMLDEARAAYYAGELLSREDSLAWLSRQA